ncbi:MAG: phosphoribosyltransferase family protein [Candidatus Bathyarchaeia archaeon]
MLIGWLYVDSLCKVLAREVREPEVVVGILKGGMIPAVIISNILRKPLLALGVHHPCEYVSRGVQIYQNLRRELLAGRKVLLVDDICDTGETLRAAKEHVEGLGGKVETAVLQKRHGSTFTPDYWVEEVWGWVVYPWEVGRAHHV